MFAMNGIELAMLALWAVGVLAAVGTPRRPGELWRHLLMIAIAVSVPVLGSGLAIVRCLVEHGAVRRGATRALD